MKEGYKRYEFGYIPNEWNVKRIGEIYKDLKAGATPSRSNSEYFNGDIPWITSGELKSKFIYNTYEKISKEGLESANLRIYPKGTFFIAITGLEAEGTRGSCGINAIDSATNQSCLAFRKSQEVNTEYLYYWYLLYGDFIGLRYTQGTKQQSLNNKIVEGLEFAYPALKEQEKIADILSTVDSQIDDTDKLIEKIKELKKGLMQRLLTKGIGHTQFKKTEVGEVPVEWEMKSLGKVFKLSSGEFLSQKNIIDGPYPVYGGNGITGYHNEFKHKDSKIVIGRVGAKCGCVCRSIKESWITDNALYINEKLCEFDDEFMLYLLYYLHLNKFANQNAQPVISGQKIYVINIALPNLGEQEKIANILSSVDKQIEEYENKKLKLEELKKGLMQQLLTGKVRVKV